MSTTLNPLKRYIAWRGEYDFDSVPASSDDGGLEVVEATGAVPLADLFNPPTTDDDETEESDGMISLR